MGYQDVDALVLSDGHHHSNPSWIIYRALQESEYSCQGILFAPSPPLQAGKDKGARSRLKGAKLTGRHQGLQDLQRLAEFHLPAILVHL